MKSKLNIFQKPILWLLCSVLFFKGCAEDVVEFSHIDFKIPTIEHHLKNYSELDSVLNNSGFHMDSIHLNKSVPEVYVDLIQPSIKELEVDIKKRNFIRILLSYTLNFNRRIGKTRLELIKTLNKKELITKDSIWLDSLSDVYRVKKKQYSKLIQKIDIIPPSLIIVQGIIESGWATSKYAIRGNNLFGLYGGKKVKTSSGGMRPRAKSFNNIEECIAEYITNLNRHFAYRNMRRERAEMRELGLNITGRKLAGTLMNYSVLGERYVRKIVSMINMYNLEEYDQYILNEGIEVRINIQE